MRSHRLTAATVATAALLAAAAACAGPDTVEVAVGRYTVLDVEIATTPEQRSAGLSGLSEIADDVGMLFPFAPSDDPQLWMAHTLVPLDAVWIKNQTVVKIQNMTPCTEVDVEKCRIWTPGVDVDAVLEVPSSRHPIALGDRVTW